MKIKGQFCAVAYSRKTLNGFLLYYLTNALLRLCVLFIGTHLFVMVFFVGENASVVSQLVIVEYNIFSCNVL